MRFDFFDDAQEVGMVFDLPFFVVSGVGDLGVGEFLSVAFY